MYYKKTKINQAMTYVPLAQRNSGFHKPTINVAFCTPRRCLVMLAAVLVVGTVFIQCLFSFRHAFSDMHLRTDVDGELVVVSSSIAKKHKAVCLDGESIPGYYFKRGVDEGEKKWLIIFPHSEWCNSLHECASRASVPLVGTMKDAPVTHQFTIGNTADSSSSEYFTDWNMVRLIPCDGSSFLGNVTDEKGLSSRGAAVLSAVVDHLLTYSSISHSEEVVLYGINSGAVSAVAYTSYIRGLLPAVTKFTTLLHSGLLFQLRSSFYNVRGFFHLHNLPGNTLLSDCKTVTCLHADSLFHRPRATPIIVYTSANTGWPLRILYGCDDNRTEPCVKSKEYTDYISSLHSNNKTPVKLLTVIVPNCDWLFTNRPMNQDPAISHLSIYALQAQNLPKLPLKEVYIENGNCSSKIYR